jgi:hypothetical protein
MLVGRLIRISKDIVAEYTTFKISEKLAEAQNVSTQRTNANNRYAQQARDLRAWARGVLATSKFNKYPDDLQRLLKASNYSSALPSNIAQVILAGFPDDANLAISSSELGLYVNLVNVTRNELSSFLNTSTKFNAQEIIVPENEISIDVLIPRQVFEDEMVTYIDILSKFSRMMSYMIELTTGSARAPTLTYTSKSDPVTGFAMFLGSVWAFLKFYNLLLEVAEKQLGLIKMIKDFRSSGLAEVPNFEDQIEATIEKALQAATEKAVTTVEAKVSQDRVNEIKNAISKDSRFAVKAIGSGVRVSITIESLDKLPEIVSAVPELTMDTVIEELASQRTLEKRIEQTLLLLGEPPAILLPKDGPEAS